MIVDGCDCVVCDLSRELEREEGEGIRRGTHRLIFLRDRNRWICTYCRETWRDIAEVMW